MNSNLNNENDQWELSLDRDDSDLRLIPVLHPSSSTRVETSPSTQNPVRIISGPAGIVQASKLLKQKDILLGLDGAIMYAQEYMKKVVEDVGEDEDFKSGSWVNATDYVNENGGTISGCFEDIKNFLNNGRLDQVVAIFKSCSLNVIGDLTVTMKDLSVFSPKPSMHYLNITMRNVVKVFRKDTVPGSGSGYLTEKEQQQLLLDEDELRETLEEEAKAEKELEERIKMLEEEARKEQAHDELFRLEFGVKSDSEYDQIKTFTVCLAKWVGAGAGAEAGA
ncbi:hypothetical protein Tco_1240114 [Tanacetum coccineum]